MSDSFKGMGLVSQLALYIRLYIVSLYTMVSGVRGATNFFEIEM
jgi:hypothetical protein